MIFGLTPATTVCGTCTLVLEPQGVVASLTTDANGQALIPLALSPAIWSQGASLLVQAMVDAPSTCGPRMSFSNGLFVTVE